MNDLYKDVSFFFRPITANNIYDINRQFCLEDGFLPNKTTITLIEPKLYSAYYYFLGKIDENNLVSQAAVRTLIPDVAGMICYYIASNQLFPTANKRTAAASADLYLYVNHLTLSYQEIATSGTNELADLIIGIGNKSYNKMDVLEWFRSHCL